MTEIQSIFQKYADVIICKFEILSLEAIMMTSWVNWMGQMRHEIISPTHNLSKYEKILGVPIYSEELQWILYRHVFAHVLWIKITQIRARFQLWRTLIALLKGYQSFEKCAKWTRKLSKCLEKCAKYDDRENFGDLEHMLQNAKYAQKTRAHARERDFLSNAPYGYETYAKKIWDDLRAF